MKRIWFAVIFLALAAALCVTEQQYIRRFHTAMDDRITAAITAAEKNHQKELEASLQEVKTCWLQRNETLCMLSNHAVPDEIGTCVRAANAENPDISEELERIRALNDIYFENQHITFANIF